MEMTNQGQSARLPLKVTCECKDFLRLDELTEFQGGLKQRDDSDIEKIIRSIEKYGFSFPFFVWRHDGINHCLDGHGRMLALYKLNEQGCEIPELPVVYVDCKDEQSAKDLLLRLNSQYGKMTKESVLEFIGDFEIDTSDLELPNNVIEFVNDEPTEMQHNKLSDSFVIPPLSILDATQGAWQDRKKTWKSIGMKSEEGRHDGMLKALSKLAKKGFKCQAELSDESIFDPVLCEVLYSWFCKGGGQILDPFCGGSVRGIVASFKDMYYTGFDIRQEQVEANESQLHICKGKGKQPCWICSDSNEMDLVLPEKFQADLVFSCPPYADLEVYSDNEKDLSNMPYNDFRTAYFSIVKKACSYLKNNRFACFVVGEVRNSKGFYYNFVSDTISAFEEAGLKYYNEMILKTQIAAKAMTCAEGMRKSRKIGKVHQNILVFIKGDPKQAAEELGTIEVINIEELAK